ncbi:hypothetical protein VTN00DRAFT_8427 [Thermoascus crustaceus]|uniref:uncharacterized protein n=1 Tax=Thermoascus crustaceus TaxID=5088 RepID=UPI00374493E2
MDFLQKALGKSDDNQSSEQFHEQQKKQEDNGFAADIKAKLNAAMGGGQESEKNEDLLDKGIDYVQQYILKQGAQDDESAFEQAKDDAIADFIRSQYKSSTGKEFPIPDKE